MQLQMENLLEDVLGKSTPRQNNTDLRFFCPFCNHAKKKLEVNKFSGKWKCWVCLTKGRSIESMFIILHLDTKTIELAKQFTNSDADYTWSASYETLRLPSDYIPLWNYPNTKDILYKRAMNYCIQERALTPYDIIKYRLGVCKDGPYRDRLVVPSYDSKGILNFFAARALYGNMGQAYSTPNVSKNIIFFELYINWNEPIILVEGPFDAMAVKRNVIPLQGKNIPEILFQKIIEHNVSEVYIGLDPDARKQSVKHLEYFIRNGIKTYFLDLPSDPGQMGFSKMIPLIKATKPVSLEQLVALQFSI
jgi:hypothetical protein